MKLDIQRFAVTKTTTFSETNLDASANTSTLKITIYFSPNNSVTYFSGKTLSCTCNGVTKSASVSLSKGGSVTKTFTFDNIQHEIDGTKTVSWNWKINTGTSVLGTLTDSGTKELTSLHKPPLVSDYTIEEVNPQLISAGISDDVFVLGLSQKAVNITYELFDGATLSEARVTDGETAVSIYDENDFPIIYDLSQFNMMLEEDLQGVLKAGILTVIRDSMGASKLFSHNIALQLAVKDYYDYIPYTPVSITESITTAKRLGQTSGRVGLNINGTYYNGAVGNVSQSSYIPTIKYKYWKLGDSEPLTYTNTIPSADITTSDGTFSVTDYDIGSSVETDTNYFDPEYAYRIKVYVEDNFTTTESNEISVPKGIPIFTEYADRVDFIKLTIQGNEIQYKNILTAKPTEDTTLTTQNATKVTLEESYSVGNKLSISSGGIKIGSGVTKVLVSGTILFTTGGTSATRKGIHIYMYDASANTTNVIVYNNIGGSVTYTGASCTPFILEVEEDDIIYMYGINQGATGSVVSKDNSYLNVEVVE